MPNHCENDLKIWGSVNKVRQFRARVAGEENNPLDFNQILPMPKELRDTVSGVCVIDGESVRVWRTREVNGQTVNEKIDSEGLKKKYGADNWYDWSNANWGTKWNSYSHGEVEEEESGDELTLTFHFDTAWSPPLPVVHKAAELYPDLAFELRYFECGAGYNGILRLGSDYDREETGPYFGDRGG